MRRKFCGNPTRPRRRENSLRENTAQRWTDLRELETESGAQGRLRNHALACVDDLRHLAVEQLEREPGDRSNRGAMKRPRQFACELGVGDWIRGSRIHGAAEGGCRQRKGNERRYIIQMYPRHPLPAV